MCFVVGYKILNGGRKLATKSTCVVGMQEEIILYACRVGMCCMPAEQGCVACLQSEDVLYACRVRMCCMPAEQGCIVCLQSEDVL